MDHKVRWILILALLIQAEAFSQFPLLAFPGAEGFGRYAKGGRGGRVIRPTTAALFKAACTDSSGKRIVIPQFGGTFDYTNLAGEIVVTKRYLTVPGQCVPGDGTELRACTFKIQAPEVIIQGIHNHVGDDIVAGVNPQARDAWQVGGGNAHDSVWNVIVDHSEGAWGLDENFSVGDSASRVSFSWNISSWCLFRNTHPEIEHSKGMLWHSTSGDSVSFTHNLMAHNDDRNPRMVGRGYAEVADNYMYNYFGPTQVGNATSQRLELRRNYYRPGLDTPANKYGMVSGGSLGSDTKIYAEGNRGYNRLTDTGDEWGITNLSTTYQSTVPLFGKTTTDQDVDSIAVNTLLSKVGPWPRCPVDSAVIASIAAGTGNIINGVTARTINYPYGTILHWGRGAADDTIKIAIAGIGSSSNRYAGLLYKVDSGTGAGQSKVVTFSSIQNNDQATGGQGCFLIFTSQFGTILDLTSVGHIEQIILTPVSPVGWPTFEAGTALTDTDADGLPNLWEVYFGGTTTSITQSAVYTSDGRTYMDWYMAHCLTLRMAGLPIEPRYLM